MNNKLESKNGNLSYYSYLIVIITVSGDQTKSNLDKKNYSQLLLNNYEFFSYFFLIY